MHTYCKIGLIPGPSAGVLGVIGVMGPMDGFGVEGNIPPMLPPGTGATELVPYGVGTAGA